MRSLLKKIVIHILLPLVVGLFIYVGTRQMPIHLFHALGNFPHDTIIENLQNESWLPRIIILSGPDFLWSYSFASALFIWKSYGGGQVSFSFFILVTVIMACSELIQLFFPGYFTFDIADLVAAILATGLSYFLNNRNA